MERHLGHGFLASLSCHVTIDPSTFRNASQLIYIYVIWILYDKYFGNVDMIPMKCTYLNVYMVWITWSFKFNQEDLFIHLKWFCHEHFQPITSLLLSAVISGICATLLQFFISSVKVQLTRTNPPGSFFLITTTSVGVGGGFLLYTQNVTMESNRQRL